MTVWLKHIRIIFIILVPLFLAACALGDVSDATPLPAITLPAPPALILSGTCEDTKNLENWLQSTTLLVSSFQTQMNAAAAKARTDLYTDVLDLAALRDAAFAVPTPDCAQQAQLTLTDAMSQSVAAFQAFVNGNGELGNIVAETNTKLDFVIAQQTSLLTRMSQQFQQSESTNSP